MASVGRSSADDRGDSGAREQPAAGLPTSHRMSPPGVCLPASHSSQCAAKCLRHAPPAPKSAPTRRPESPPRRASASVVRRWCSVCRRTTMSSMTVLSGKHPTPRFVFSPQYPCYGVAILAWNRTTIRHRQRALVCAFNEASATATGWYATHRGEQLYRWEAVERVSRSSMARSATPPRAPAEQEELHA